MAYIIAVNPPRGHRTWTVMDASYRTVLPVEEWLEAHRGEWSPNTVRSYAASLAQWWTFLEQREEAERWDCVGVPAVSAYLGWLRNGRTVERIIAGKVKEPEGGTLENRLASLISFYRWQGDVHDVQVAGRLLKGVLSRAATHGLLSHLESRRKSDTTSIVRVRKSRSRDRTPVLLPRQVQGILDACAVYDAASGEWTGNLRDRLLFSLLAETGMRLGEVLGMRVSDFVMGRGSTPHVRVIPRENNANGARVKMMRPRIVYVGYDLERLYADYLIFLAARAAELGFPIGSDGPLFVNVDRPPYLSVLRESTVYDKVRALKARGCGPKEWTPHWFRHTHATALLLAGSPEWVVSRRLGHAHVQTTIDLYAWVSEDEALRAAANWRQYTSEWKVAHG